MSISFIKDAVTVTISKNPSFGSEFYFDRKNQSIEETVDGTLRVYDAGPTILMGNIILKYVSKTEGDALISFIKSTIVFSKETFTIDPPAGTDLGGGAGIDIQSCNLVETSIKGMFEYISPGVYNINIPYRKVV